MNECVNANSDEEYAAASALFREYAGRLNIDLSFQDFESELRTLKSMYALPVGGIILYKSNDKFIGCVAIRKQEKGVAELKRMYVQPAYQKKGIGNLLLREAIELCKSCGYKKIRLDTLRNMTPAMDLYKKNGFIEIPAYYYNPQESAVYFEKEIN